MTKTSSTPNKVVKRYLRARKILIWTSVFSAIMVADFLRLAYGPIEAASPHVGVAYADAVFKVLLTIVSVAIFVIILMWYLFNWAVLRKWAPTKKVPLYPDRTPQTVFFVSLGYLAVIGMIGVLLTIIVRFIMYYP